MLLSPHRSSRVGDKGRSLAQALLQPFIDLEHCAEGPLYARGLEQYWIAFVDGRYPRFALQRTLPAEFRRQLFIELGLDEYAVEDPRDLPPQLRSRKWNAVCSALEDWAGLTIDQRGRLLLLLHALGLYSMIPRLVPDIVDLDISRSDYACLAYLRASAHYVLHLKDRVADYAEADLSEFKAIVREAPRNALTAFNAVIKILTHKAKVLAPVCELNEWLIKAEEITAAVMAAADDFTGKLVLSRYYRAAAFLPQREGNRAEVIRVMDLAEQQASSMTPMGRAQELLYLENLHPVLESRTKEAIWLGDLDLALSRALRVTELDPYDPKPWLELGQVRLRRNEITAAAEAYSVAAILGPPATAIAHHMTGQCFRDLKQPALAALFFKIALEVDPRAISPHDEIQTLPDEPVLQALKKWSIASFEF